MLTCTLKIRAQASKTPRKIVLKPAKSILIILLLCTISFSLYQVRQAKCQTLTVGPTGPPLYDYSKIRDAVNAATAGDTIQVAAGIYYEHVGVNKTLTITGENPQTTIIDGSANGTIFELSANNVRITGFTIRNAGKNSSAISIDNDVASDNFDTISNNIITSSLYGVLLSLSHKNTISENNIMTSKQYGVFMSGSHQNKIFSNTLIDNQFGGIYANGASIENITGNTVRGSAYGIRGVSSTNNIIVGNTISQTSYAIHLSSASTGNTISRNILSGTNTGIYTSSDSTTADHNTITGGASGMYYANCRFGSISYNNINSSTGIRLYWSSATTSSHNVNNNRIVGAAGALYGIEITNANGNTLTGNWLQQDTWGIYMTASSNTIYHNNFVNNGMGAYCGGGTNTWDNGSHGNYWSDYPAQYDTNGDGIGENPYNITAVGKDNHPLINTWSEHDISTRNVTTSRNIACPGLIVNITVTVRNNANISVSETFTVKARYNSTNIETKTVSNLAQGEPMILTFRWNTTGLAYGYYIMSVIATPVADETNTDNNIGVDGTVMISIQGDVNGDTQIDVLDILKVKSRWGTTPASPNWIPEYDVNDDKAIDVLDILSIKANWGQDW